MVAHQKRIEIFKIQKILVMTTGGTIEKTYCEEDGLLANRTSAVERLILSKLRLPHTQVQVIPIMNKDSLDINDQDRLEIVRKIRENLHLNAPILLIHGTDTLVKTAELCQTQLGQLSIPLVFTGAMRPMGFEDTDAYQNVTEALMALKLLSPGVYISFHNQVFPIPGARKNRERRTFEFT